MANWKSTHGPDTYLHAGSSQGWPADHTAEDTFECPPIDRPDIETAPEYSARFSYTGAAHLIKTTTTRIATFETFADAQTAAKALNELKGY